MGGTIEKQQSGDGASRNTFIERASSSSSSDDDEKMEATMDAVGAENKLKKQASYWFGTGASRDPDIERASFSDDSGVESNVGGLQVDFDLPARHLASSTHV